jgi:hypothetical protein
MEEVVEFIVQNINSEMPEHYIYGYVYKEAVEDDCFESLLSINEWFKQKLDEKLDKEEISYNSLEVCDNLTNVIMVFTYKNKRCEISEKFGREDYWVILITEAI